MYPASSTPVSSRSNTWPEELIYHIQLNRLSMCIYRGAQNFFSELLRWIPGDGVWYASPNIAPHVTSDLMKLTQFHKGNSIFNRQLLKHSSVFCSTYFYQTSQLDHGAFQYLPVRNVAISWFCTVLQCVRSAQRTWAHTSLRLSFVSSYGTSCLGATFREKTFFFCSGSVCLFFAGGEHQSICSMYFVF